VVQVHVAVAAVACREHVQQLQRRKQRPDPAAPHQVRDAATLQQAAQPFGFGGRGRDDCTGG
jgi:hypothetical protein